MALAQHCAHPSAAQKALEHLIPQLKAEGPTPVAAGRAGAAALVATLAGSRAAARYFMQYPRLAYALLADRRLHEPLTLEELTLASENFGPPTSSSALWFRDIPAAAPDDVEAVAERLRRIRIAVWLRVVAREMAGFASSHETGRELAELAESLLTPLLKALRHEDEARFGAWAQDNERVGFVVLAQGKLGAYDLNISSDIDIQLVCARVQSHGEELGLDHLFDRLTRVSQRFIELACAHTPSGWLYRVDLDLRPFGRSGPIVNRVASLEHYYETHGAHWERLALVRARPVAGDVWVADRLLQRLHPFIWPQVRSPQFISELRALRRRGLPADDKQGIDVKRGLGGIRDIELFVHVHQVLGGAFDPSLRSVDIEEALSQLQLLGILHLTEATCLGRSYALLRRVENVLQTRDEQQTHRLPLHHEELNHVAAILKARGRRQGWQVTSGQSLLRTTRSVMRRVAALVARLDAPEQTVNARVTFEQKTTGAAAFVAAPNPRRRRQLAIALSPEQELAGLSLASLGFGSADQAFLKVQRLSGAIPRNFVPALRGHRELLLALLGDMADTPNPTQALTQLLALMPAFKAHRGFFVLLLEQQLVRRRLIDLLGASRFLGNILIRHPELIDWIFQPGLNKPVSSQSTPLYSSLLHDRLGPITRPALKWRAWAHFVREYTLAVGSYFLAHRFSVAQTLTALGQIIESALGEALAMCSAEMGLAADTLAVVALGRLGSGQQAFGSDVDLVFVASDSSPETLYAAERLARHLVSQLGDSLHGAAAIDVDLRLRPYGSDGPLVTTPSALITYHRHHAQLWERQAWLKARTVAGNHRVGAVTLSEVFQHLFRSSPPQGMADEARRMRQKMRDEASSRVVDLKRASGGLADIELGTQLLQLALGHRYPDLRVGPLHQALHALAATKTMPVDMDDVAQVWTHLRQIELAWRIGEGARDTHLPLGGPALNSLAVRLGHTGPRGSARLLRDMARYRRCAQRYFNACLRAVRALEGAPPTASTSHSPL